MKFAKKTDLIIVLVLVAASVLGWIAFNGNRGRAGAAADIYYESELVKTVDLSVENDISFSIPQAPNVVFHQYADGSIAFIESDCPDKICIQTGRLHRVGQMAACLPNQIVVKITSADAGNHDEPDIVIG